MKKTILLCGILFVTVAANAQFYVGGSAGVNVDKYGENVNGYLPGTRTTFSIFPEFGYRLNSKLDIGLSIGYGSSRWPSYAVDGEKDKTTNWEIAPYLRYSLVRFGNLSVFGKAAIHIGEDKSANYSYNDLLVPGKTKISYYGLDIKPVLVYSLSNHFDLLGDLNFLSLSLYRGKEKDADTMTRFNFGANAGDAITSIGFIYKF
jgi:hypothetical protein